MINLLKSAWGFILDDFYRKLAAFFLGLFIWVYVNRHINEVEIFKNVKVDVRPFSNEQRIVSRTASTIAIEVRGPRKLLNSLETKDFTCSLELDSSLRPGKRNIDVLEENIRIPSGLKLESFSTQTSVDVDVISEKEVDIQLLYNTDLLDGFELSRRPRLNYTKTTIKGPSRLLERIDYVTTRPIRIDRSRIADYITAATLSAPEGASLNYDKVTVTVEIRRRLEFRNFPRLPIHVMQSNKSSAQALSHRVFLTVSGPAAILKELEPAKDIRLFVEDDGNDSRKIKFWCSDPAVKAVTIEPSSIDLKP